MLLLRKADDGIYSKTLSNISPKLLNAAKYFAHLNRDIDTSISEFDRATSQRRKL